jgi:uncharacterized membrane protein
MKGGKREKSFIKDDIAWYVDTTSGDVEALKAFVHRTIAKERTLRRAKR